MKIDVLHIAKLASLPLRKEEIEKYENQLSEILEYIEKLKKVKKLVQEALTLIVEEGKDRAMGEINAK